MSKQLVNFELGISINVEGLSQQSIVDALSAEGVTIGRSSVSRVLAGGTARGFELIEVNVPSNIVETDATANVDQKSMKFWFDKFSEQYTQHANGETDLPMIPLNNVDHYAELICEESGMEFDDAYKLAREMADYVDGVAQEQATEGTEPPSVEPEVVVADVVEPEVTPEVTIVVDADKVEDGVVVTGDDEPAKVEPEAKVEVAKGPSKADKAREVFNAMYGAADMTPKLIKEAMIEKAGLTKAGASTYYYNFKRKLEESAPKAETPEPTPTPAVEETVEETVDTVESQEVPEVPEDSEA